MHRYHAFVWPNFDFKLFFFQAITRFSCTILARTGSLLPARESACTSRSVIRRTRSSSPRSTAARESGHSLPVLQVHIKQISEFNPLWSRYKYYNSKIKWQRILKLSQTIRVANKIIYLFFRLYSNFYTCV